jgi:hypothetical protein
VLGLKVVIVFWDAKSEGLTGCLPRPLCTGPLGVVNGSSFIWFAGCCTELPCMKLLTGSLTLGALTDRAGVTWNCGAAWGLWVVNLFCRGSALGGGRAFGGRRV